MHKISIVLVVLLGHAFAFSACQASRSHEESGTSETDSLSETLDLDSMLLSVRRAYVRNDLESALEETTRGGAIAKQRGLPVKESMFDFYYGVCQTWLEQVPEGLKRMQDAVKIIGNDQDSTSICILPSCYKELASAHIALEDLDAAIEDCLEREVAIDNAQKAGANETFVDAQHGSNAIMLATLYDFTGNESEGCRWLQRFYETAYAKTQEGAHGLLDYYNSTDQAEEYIETFERVKGFFGSDTLNIRYRDEMMYLINAYHVLGDMDGMGNAISRVVALNDSVMVRTVRSNSLKLQEKYKVKKALMEMEQGRRLNDRNIRLALIIGALMLLVIGVLLRFNLRIQNKNKILARQANKVNELEEQLARRHRGRQQDGDAITDEELENRLNDWLDANDRFLTKVTIQEAAAALRVTQKRIAETLEAQGKYRNLEEWATHKRVSRACRLILNHPEYTIESIAADAGFSSPRTFYRKFQSEMGLSPTEYRQATMKA
ncbi:MAG: AraC family transcriptional regulator [Bacteroidaceae bacterium]|nr:AraC family transcriptional regulator [Bacteroidaceae bacterium]